VILSTLLSLMRIVVNVALESRLAAAELLGEALVDRFAPEELRMEVAVAVAASVVDPMPSQPWRFFK
jgi:hypothetical protein